jgi:hypothetical protein
MCTVLEQIQKLPGRISELVMASHEAIQSLGQSADPAVNRDLDNYMSFLRGLKDKAFRSTDSLLAKPRVVATLRGEAVVPGGEDAKAKLAALRRQLEQLTQTLGGEEEGTDAAEAVGEDK